MPIMKLSWKPKVQKIVACLAILAVMSGLLAVVNPYTAKASNTTGTAATSLVFKVGYSGGSYSTVCTFTYADIRALANVQQAYSFIDNMPAPINDPALGVKLTDLLISAKIDVNSVQGFTFYSTDGYITKFTKSALLDTPRYYYPNIVKDWDSANGTADLSGATDGAVQVPTILAVEDNWARFEDPADFSAMTGVAAFRLMFGQTDTSTHDASESAKWVDEVDVTMTPVANVSLASPTVGQTYHPGDTVSVAGAVYNLAAATVNVTDPNGTSVFTSGSLNTSSGSLATSFTLSSAAVTGQYTISITGTGLTSACTSTFSVASPDASISLTSPAAGQTYWPGQEVSVAGAVYNLAGATATVIVDGPGGNSIYMANDLGAGSGQFSTGFTLGNDPASGTYAVWIGEVGTSVAYTSTFNVANPGTSISLASPAADQTYNPGDTVSVAGAVYNLAAATVNVTDPDGTSVFTKGLDTSGGSLATSFTLSGAAITGRYAVTISAPSLGAPYTEKINVGQSVAGGPNTGLPDQIILSWTDNPDTTRTISWRTGSDTTQDEVEYLPAAGFNGSFTGAGEAIAAENDLYPGSYHFEATIRRLSPGTGYVYRVGRDGAWSQPASFITAVPSGDFSFLYMGDVQEGYQEWGDLLQVAAKENPGPKFGLLGGDIVNDSTQDQWQQFFAAAAPLFSQVSLMPATGNHDDSTLEWDSFAVPQNGPDGYKEFYSFDYENAHIVILDSNLLAAPGTDEFNTISAWLQNDLNSSSKTWKFVVLHYPPYEVYPDNHVANIQANWAPIFEQCGVDVVFDGHQQVYARTSPMKAGQIQSDGNGIVYIMGNAGTKYLADGPYYDYVVKELADVSNYEVVNIDGNTFTMTAKDANGRVIDSYQLTKTVTPTLTTLTLSGSPSLTYSGSALTYDLSGLTLAGADQNGSAYSLTGDTVTWAVYSGPATVSGSTLTITGSGTVGVTATVEGITSNLLSFTVAAASSGGGSGASQTAISTVSAVNGAVTVTLSATPTATPVLDDFTVTQSINGAAATSVAPNKISTSGATVTLTVPTVSATTSSQSVLISVSYRGGTAVAAVSAFTVAAASSGGGGGGSSATTTAPVTSTTGSATVTPANGGTISLGSDVTLDIPADTLQGSSATTVQIQKLSSPPAAPSGFKLLGSVYEFSIGGKTSYTFNGKVTLTFTFDLSSLTSGEAPSIYYYDEAKGQWVDLGGAVSGDTITVTVDHFTKFAVLAKEAAATPVLAPVFSDIPASYWAYGVINSLSGQGFISGYPNGAFRPDAMITRAELVSIIGKAVKLQAYSPAAPDFSDISSADWFYGSVESAVYTGIIKGEGSSIFGPNKPISRQELACILVNALGKQDEAIAGASQQSHFTDDAGISSWARGSVGVAVKYGLFKGYPDGNFKPQGDATRAEAAAVIAQALKQ